MVSPPSPAVVVSQMRAASPEDSLAASTETQLVKVGRRNEPSGVLVMALARSIDTGGHSGASLAALSKEFARALATALENVGEDAEIVDGIDWGVK